MSSYSTIQTRVSTIVIDLPAAVQAAIPAFVNTALRTLQGHHNYKVMEASQTFTTTLNTRTLGALNSNFKAYRARPYLVRNSGSTGRIEIVDDPVMLYPEVDEASINYPRFITRQNMTEAGASELWVYPLPDGNSDYNTGEYRIIVPYWKYVAPLVSAGDTNWFTENAENYLVYQAASEAFALDWDATNLAIWFQKAETERRLVEKLDKMQALSGVDTLVPQYKGVRSPLIRS